MGAPRPRSDPERTSDPERPQVRPARPADAEDLRSIERKAGERFNEIGMAFVAAHEPPSAEELAEYAIQGRSWVAVDDQNRPVGYVIVDVVDGCAHIEQVSIVPEYQNQGLGRALIDTVDNWAAGERLDAITLTTFTDVEWNRPLYEHLGFAVLQQDELSPGLKAIRDSETKRGLDPETRVCMSRAVSRIRSD